MTPPLPKSESLQNSPHWDEYLLARLEEFESALHRGSVPPLSNPGDLSDCPPEIAAELRRLQSLLLWVENVVPPANVHSGANVKSAGSTTTPDSEPQTLPLPSASPRSSPDQSWSDLRMGRFELGLKLGEGTYGIVYLAQDPRLKRLVALKIPRLDAAFREDLRERFIREGESAARLTHPNIVTVFEAVSEGPISFIASEYIPGPNLATWLAEHSSREIPPREAARLIADLAAGVAHAHAKNVLHRDIKPSNILLAPRTDNPNSLGDYQPKLTDFGLAKLLETQDATLSGAIVGTPAYMPPEQIAGETAQIGPAVDIYALGMVLYQLLTGSNPFLKSSVGETIHAVTSANLPAPSGIHRAVPRDLETICLKCLRRDRHERYATAADLAADLERYLTNRPIRARNVSPLERAIKWTRRYPALTISTLAAFLLLISLLALSESNRKVVEDRELKLLRRTYLDDMQRAGEAWNANHTDIALDILKAYLPDLGEPDVRDFAWWAIWNEYHDNSRILSHHRGGATAVACTSSDPVRIFTAGADSVIRIWDLDSRKQIGELRGHRSGPIHSLQLNREESLLLSAGEDGTVRIWNLKENREQVNFRGHRDWVATAHFSPDEKLVASGGADEKIRLWDPRSGAEVRVISGHTDTVRALVFHPSNDWLISSSQDRTLRLWKVSTGEPDSLGIMEDNRFLSDNLTWGDSLVIAPDQKSFALAGNAIWSLQDKKFGTLLKQWNNPERVRSLKVLPDGRCVYAMEDSTVGIHHNWFNFHGSRTELRGHRAPVHDLVVLPDGRGIVSASMDGDVRIWSPAALNSRIPLIERKSHVQPELKWRSLRWTNDLLCYSLQVENRESVSGLVDMTDCKRVGEYRSRPILDSRMDASFNAERDCIWTIEDTELRCHRAAKQELLWKFDLKQKQRIEIDSTGKFACMFELNPPYTKGRLFDLDDREFFAEIELSRGFSTFFFMKSAPVLIVASDDGYLRGWKVARGKLTPLMERFLTSGGISRLSISTCGRFIVADRRDAKTTVWTYPDLREVLTVSHESNRRPTREFVVDNGKKLVLFLQNSNTLEFWDVEEKKMYARMDLKFNRSGIELSPDGTRFALSGYDGLDLIDGRPRSDQP